jgi:4-hydroxy-L-threonine phosphate dehydrogenase PdxA
MPDLPRVGLLLGDPSGIGPELVARLLSGDDLDREVRRS